MIMIANYFGVRVVINLVHYRSINRHEYIYIYIYIYMFRADQMTTQSTFRIARARMNRSIIYAGPSRICVSRVRKGSETGRERGKVEREREKNRFRLGNCFPSITVAIPRDSFRPYTPAICMHEYSGMNNDIFVLHTYAHARAQTGRRMHIQKGHR
jgi:hypothetical protein